MSYNCRFIIRKYPHVKLLEYILLNEWEIKNKITIIESDYGIDKNHCIIDIEYYNTNCTDKIRFNLNSIIKELKNEIFYELCYYLKRI